MVAKEFFIIAGDPEGDELASKLVTALTHELAEAESRPGYGTDAQPLHASLEPRFYGFGGTQMREASVELIADLAAFTGAQRARGRHLRFRRIFAKLYQTAVEREPHAIIGVEPWGFTVRLMRAIQQLVRKRQGTFNNWEPILIQVTIQPGWDLFHPREHPWSEAATRPMDRFRYEPSRYQIDAPNGSVEWSDVQSVARRIAQLLESEEEHFPLRASLA